MADANLIRAITKNIVDHFNPQRIILFGSHGRGEGGPDSDLDLFIEMETDQRPPERAIAVSSIFGLRTWPLDVVVYTPEEVRRLRNVKGTLLSTIESEGKVLHARS